MNRPSRTEDDLEHPTWNQSPPFLAPDLTTRQDLNGISNAREQRGSCSAAGSFVLDEKQRLEMNRFQNPHAKGRDHVPPAMGVTNGKPPPPPDLDVCAHRLLVPSIASPTLPGGEGQARSTRSAQLLGWVAWVASVAVMSVVVSFVRDGLPSLSHPADRPTASPAPVPAAVESPPLRLARRQTACGVGGAPADYNMPLHVGAVFIVLGVSGGACAFPLLASKFPFMKIHSGFLFAIRHFGTGVLLATAFVHLLPTAFISLGDPCLSNFWTTDYPPMPGAIALVGIFLVTVIEMVFSPARFFTPKAGRAAENGDAELRVKEEGRPVRLSVAGHCSNAEVAAAVTRPAQPQSRVSIEVASPRNSGDADPRSSSESMAEVSHIHVLTPEQQHKKSILQCMMLEVGILFHSVFIGMALSVAVGGDFIVLLIAIAFHRTSPDISPPRPLYFVETDLPSQKHLKAWPWAPASRPSRGPRARCSRG